MPSDKVKSAPVEVPEDSLTLNDSKIINVILRHCSASSKPTSASIDWEAVIQNLDFKTAESARERFRQLCKKHNWFESNKDPSTASSTPKKRAASQAFPALFPKEEETTSPRSDCEADVNSPVTPIKKRKFGKFNRKMTKEKTPLMTLDNVNKKRRVQRNHGMSDSDEA
ncbi:hypothetical protein F4781DRAFT_428508 [Annulohypoxylon bovei var. microspora]|nr:hypothetical protein F4781DRAFT_428508 [Annulohypoxylon bovei var. microspora]